MQSEDSTLVSGLIGFVQRLFLPFVRSKCPAVESRFCQWHSLWTRTPCLPVIEAVIPRSFQRTRDRPAVQSDIPRISAAWTQLIDPLMARVMTSLIFIARSRTRVGYKCIRDSALRMLLSQNPSSQTGHFICYSPGHIMCYRHCSSGTLDTHSCEV